ncbi:cbb3-type cytochrome oxidase assembly protein CcoS [Melioribacteraceae bacterium 4301-Me]|uniref:cbb3-type cytochrome oxidase assembly protein CcoS n=1 Tax=Pyranulibacter aquaticus TaxID=3163344 RepID=UPI003598F030
MSVIIVLLAFSLLIAVGFLIAYLWAVKDGQFDDKYTPSIRILFDNEKNKISHQAQNSELDKSNNDLSNQNSEFKKRSS